MSALLLNAGMRVWFVPYVNAVVVTVALLAGSAMHTQAQDRCGTVQYTKLLLQKNRLHEDDDKFEKWLRDRIPSAKARVAASDVFRIPVVFHIIHNGEAVGSGVNITEAQIASQLKVLNNDFKRLNADTSETPTDFLAVAGKINIEFVAAKQSPDGKASNGIVRVKGTKRQWTIDDNESLKTLSYWPAEDYLNIWVTDIASSILGYAQFPVANLPGLEDAENNRLTDGVVLDYRVVGSSQDGSFNLTNDFNRGRTATHEVGHFFGLRHIWGDDEGACSGNGDYVDDTPDQGNSSDGCPSHPQISCNVRTMFQNYMDYTNDVCMNLYTEKQIERMLTVLGNSPRRTSLLTSKGLYDPAPVNNDLAIVEILSPYAQACIGTVIPQVVVRNNGVNTVTSARIQFSADNIIHQVKDESFSGLEPGDEIEVSFDPYSLEAGTDQFSFQILLTNRSEDGKTNDNTASITTEVPDQIQIPFAEAFDVLPATWSVTDNGETSWSIALTDNASNKAVSLQFFQSQDAADQIDIITTPVFNLSHAASPFVAFDVAYAAFPNRSDGLEVYVLLNCNTDLTTGQLIYSKRGSALATAASTASSFLPVNEHQWRREVLDLYQFIGESHVQLAFVAVNDSGNNLYLDNIGVRTDVAENISLQKIVYPSPVHCSNAIQPSLLVKNNGSLTVNELKVVYSLNNQASRVSKAEDLNLAPGAEATVTLPEINLNDGENELAYEIIQPNGFQDIDTTDNALRVKSVVNADEDKIPLRKNFDENDEQSPWQMVNPLGNLNWTTRSTNFGQSLYFSGDTTDVKTKDVWLVSPVLDFSSATTASLFFDLSYRYRNGDSIKDSQQEVFKVLVSRDCGMTFNELVWHGTEHSLANANRSGDASPNEAGHWSKTFVNLNTLAGEENARLAFVILGSIAHSLYLDNIEFFLSDDPSPVAISDLYALYPNRLVDTKSFYVTFNLSNRQSVAYELMDMLGKQVGAKELTDVLNQTYKIDLENASSGVYLVRLLIDNRYYVSRVVVSR